MILQSKGSKARLGRYIGWGHQCAASALDQQELHDTVGFCSTACIAGTPRCFYGDPGHPGSPAYMHPSTGEGSVAPWDWSVCWHPICMHPLGRGWRQIRIDACAVVLFMTMATGNRCHLGVGFPQLPTVHLLFNPRLDCILKRRKSKKIKSVNR